MAERGIDRLAALARTRDGRADDVRARERFVHAAGVPPSRSAASCSSARWSSARWSLAAIALLSIGAALLWLPGEGASVSYHAEGVSIADGGYVRAAADGATLRFSDGSTVALAPNAAARIVEAHAHGARLSLEQGSLDVNIAPLPGASWSLAAGPYEVVVTGTRFGLAWSPADARLDLRMSEGSVEVRGPMVADGVKLRAGQVMVARVNEHDLQITNEANAARAEPSAAPEPRAANDGLVAEADPARDAAPSDPARLAAPTEPASTERAAPQRATWSALVARGEYQRVLDEADAWGLDAVMSSASMDQIVALGDAARYRGRADVARRSLVALRERFAHSTAGVTAAFMLGRMSEGAPSAAIAWYDRYLSEAPNGTYAAEALGRKLHLLSTARPADARTVAQQYLAAYPNGAYGSLARKLLSPKPLTH